MKSLALVWGLVLLTQAQPIHYELSELWQEWKSDHGKNYSSQLEELDRHLIWLSNRKYIEAHNVNKDYMGFSLAMNWFGDLVNAIIILKMKWSIIIEL